MAAAGGHSLLLVGPTGVGKSLLARCLPGLLPPLAPEEARAVAEIYARAGETPPPGRPVRRPLTGLSPARLCGGRRPGEVQLAGHGVLILEDLASLGRAAQQALSEALDGMAQAPCFLLVAALRSAACGRCDEPGAACGCPLGLGRRERARIDAALLDRFDLCTQMEAPTRRQIACAGEAGAAVAARVGAARRLRVGRPGPAPLLVPAGRDLLSAAVERLGLSPRTVVRVQEVARTIAALAGSPEVRAAHVVEAVQYRLPALAG